MATSSLYTTIYKCVINRISSVDFTEEQRVRMAKSLVDSIWETSIEQTRATGGSDDDAAKLFHKLSLDLFDL